MPLNDEILRRLAVIGVTSEADLAYWRKLGDSPRVSDAVFQLHLRRREAEGAEYRRRLPQLLAFAAACRRENPLPTMAELPDEDLAKYHILLSTMEQFARSAKGDWFLRGLPNRVPIVCTTQVGLIAADQVFGGTSAVSLEDSERDRFFETLRRADDGDGSRWFALKWWRLSDLDRSAPGEILWRLEDGSSLCEGDFYKHFSRYLWDGERATFLETYGNVHS
jgi:hypothetical protein